MFKNLLGKLSFPRFLKYDFKRYRCCVDVRAPARAVKLISILSIKMVAGVCQSPRF